MGNVIALSGTPGVDFATIQTALETAFNSVITNILGVISMVLPLGLMVLGVSVAIGFAIKFFKRLTKG